MLSEFLIHTVTFKRPSPSTDSVGGETSTETTTYDSIPACVQPAKAFQIYVYSQLNIHVDHLVYTDRTLSLRAGDVMYFNNDRFIVTGWKNYMNDNRVTEVAVYRFTS